MVDKRPEEVADRRLAGHLELFELATRQHGVIATHQLAALGYTRSAAAKANDVGRLRRVHRGVYSVGHGDLDWHGRCMAAVLAASPAVASHTTAAHLWDLLGHRPGGFHFTTPTHRRPRASWRLHCAHLEPVDRTEVDGIPVTSVARTLLDLAATRSSESFARVLERAEELRLFDLNEIEELMTRVSRHQGTSTMRDALLAYREDSAFTRSRLERRFLDLVRSAGLPPPAMNFNVLGYEIDAYWPVERLAVEIDAFLTHGSRLAFERDRLRDQRLTLAGVAVVRVTAARLEREPEQVVAGMVSLLRRRSDFPESAAGRLHRAKRSGRGAR